MVIFGGYDANYSNYSAAGYSNLNSANRSDIYGSCVMADKDVSSTGAQSGTFSTATGSIYVNGYGTIATFKESGGGGGATTKKLSLLGVG